MFQKIRTAAAMPGRLVASRLVQMALGNAAEHHFTDVVLNMPSPVWRFPYPHERLTKDESDEAVKALRKDRIYVWPGFFGKEEIAHIQKALAAEYDKLSLSIIKPAPSGGFYTTNDPMQLCPELSMASIDPDLLNIVAGYFRRGPFMSETDHRRVLPMGTNMGVNEIKRKDGSAAADVDYRWHYDLRGRQVKVQVYLTDVGRDGQYFSYLKGTHHGHKRYSSKYAKFSPEEIRAMDRAETKFFGEAGTALIFDTRGIHKLNRQEGGPVRDTVTYNFHPARMLRARPQTVHEGALARNRSLFARIMLLANS